MPDCIQQLQTHLQTDKVEDLQAGKADNDATPSELSDVQPQAGATQAGNPQASSAQAAVPGSQPPTVHQVGLWMSTTACPPLDFQRLLLRGHLSAIQAQLLPSTGLQLLCAHQLQACLHSTCIATQAHQVKPEVGGA